VPQTLPPRTKQLAKQPPPQGNTIASSPITADAARESLAYVGMDDVAEEFWLNAINSPDLSASERKNLIEDLNEVGFADPKNLTPDDVPLIESRLMILDQLGPVAIDETNAAAMQEAYKDLINMRAVYRALIEINARRSTVSARQS
jgi:hypothetical protein